MNHMSSLNSILLNEDFFLDCLLHKTPFTSEVNFCIEHPLFDVTTSHSTTGLINITTDMTLARQLAFVKKRSIIPFSLLVLEVRLPVVGMML